MLIDKTISQLLQPKIIFIGGKGGVGKTTTASALSYYSSQIKRKTLLVSTDPAHSTSDIFEQDFTGGKIVSHNGYLDIVELNPDDEIEAYLKEVKANILSIVSSPIVLEEINKQIDLAKITPGAEESALFNRFGSILIQERANYQHIIFDTAPSGHTLRMLSLPHLMGAWIDGLVKKRKQTNRLKEMWNTFQQKDSDEDTVLKILEKRKDQFSQTRDILTDKSQCHIHLVMIPEKLSLLESQKTNEILNQFNLEVNSIIVNRILPIQIKDTFFHNKMESEKQNLKEIQTHFKQQSIFTVPLLSNEVCGIKSLHHFINSIEKL